jgi:peptide deformylase
MKIFNMKDVIYDGDPRLREKSVNVEVPLNDEDFDTLQGIAAFVLESQTKEVDDNGDKYRSAVGMSAPQFGINKNMFVMVFPDDEDDLFIYAIVNPVIEEKSRAMIALTDGEACLSVPKEITNKVYRNEKIRWSGYIVNLKDRTYEQKKLSKMEGYMSIVFQHEYDHLNGILFTDISEKKSMTMALPNDPDLDTSGYVSQNLRNPNSTDGGHLK